MYRYRVASTLIPVEQSVAEAVRARLDELGWTQVELVRQAGVSSFTVQRMVNEEDATFRLEIKRKVSTALGWTPDSLDRIARGDAPCGALPQVTARSR